MSSNNKKSVAAEALLEANSIKETIKEESKNLLSQLLKEAVADVMRESIEDDEDEKDYEVIDNDAEDNDKNDEDASKSEGEVSEGGEEDMQPNGEVPAPTEEQPVDGGEVEAQEAPVEGEGGDENWSNYSQYQVGDDTYDLTGEEDMDQVVKVYKLMKDEDNVIVKKEGNTIELQDNGSGAEYVIDLGMDAEEAPAEEGGEEMAEGCVKESVDDIAGFPDNEEDEEDAEEDFNKFEGKKAKKVMKENKEMIFEVDLGYTDNYQAKDPIQGLSNNEPSKSGKSWEKGVPTGTQKPWAGDTKSKGEPFKETVKEEEIAEEPVEEGTNVGGAVQQRSNSKSHIPANRKEFGPKVKRHVSAGGDYNEVVEAYKRENKELKECIAGLRKGLQESRVVNVNLAKITKLFVENTVSQKEKIDIVNRFSEEAKTVEQSKSLYESIKKELNKTAGKQNLTVEGSMTVQNNVINENKVYQSQDVLDTLDLIKRMENC